MQNPNKNPKPTKDSAVPLVTPQQNILGWSPKENLFPLTLCGKWKLNACFNYWGGCFSLL